MIGSVTTQALRDVQLCRLNEASSRGLLGCDTAQLCGRVPTFRRNMLPPSSGWRSWKLQISHP